MSYLLDTNTCIYYLNETYPRLVERLLSEGPRALAVSSVTTAELFFGAARSSRPEQNQQRVKAFIRELTTLPFDDLCAEHFGRIKAALFEVGSPIPDFDAAIAATAFAHGCTVVSNDRHLPLVPGLPLEDWVGED